jgi:protein gp37
VTRRWWWDHAWDPVAGCKPISPGCTNCFAPRWIGTLHASQDIALYRGVTKQVNGRHVFTGKLKALPPRHPGWIWPLTWPGAEFPVMGPGQPSLIFVVVLGDLFYRDRPTAIIDKVVATIVSSRHIGLLVTKYVDQMARYFATAQWEPWQSKLWLGFSAEDQRRFDDRWPLMRPLAERGWLVFVSIAPMIAPVRLPADFLVLGGWVVVGGEEGALDDIRDMRPSWARNIRDQCARAGVPLFVKRLAGEAPIPPDLLNREFPTTERTTQ